MTIQLSKAQIEAIKVELAQYGLKVTPASKPRKAKPHFMWWKPQTLAGLGKGCISTASRYGFERWRYSKDDLNNPKKRDKILEAHVASMEAFRADAEKIGVHFPH